MLLFLLAVPVACNRGSNEPVVARVNGNDILASDVHIHLMHAEEMLFWEFFMETGSFEMDLEAPHPEHGTFGGAILNEALQSAIFYFMMVDMAEEFGVEIDEVQRLTLLQEIDMYIAEHGEEEFYELLEQDGFRDREQFIDVVSAQFLLDGLIFTLLEDDAAFAQFAHLMPPPEAIPFLYGAMHILAFFDEFDTDDDAFIYVYELLERVRAGEDFMDLSHRYSHDFGVVEFPFGYTFAAGDMLPEFDALVRELAIGEVGGPVATMHGYHIIKRIEPIDVNDWFRLQDRRPQSHEDRQVEAIFFALQERMENANVERLPAFDEIDVAAFLN